MNEWQSLSEVVEAMDGHTAITGPPGRQQQAETVGCWM
jgi:hypothetical protein